jgi:hypothetical protein
MTRDELAGTAPEAWTPAHDAAFAALILEVLSRARTLVWVMPNQSGRVAHWAGVWNRFHGANLQKVHTGGVRMQKGALWVNASAWPVGDKSGLGAERTPEQNTRVETW